MTTKSIQAQTEPEQAPKQKRNPLYRTIRTFTLASVGAVSLSSEELGRLLDRMVKRGELKSKEAQKLLDEANAKRRASKKRMYMSKTDASETKSMPSGADLEALRVEIEKLNREITALRTELPATAAEPVTEPAAPLAVNP